MHIKNKPLRIILLSILTLVFLIAAFLLLYILLRGIHPLRLGDPPGSGEVTYDVVYKTCPDGRELKLDIYGPTRQLFSKSPVVVYYHGGSWEGGSKELDADTLEGVFNPLREYGITVVAVQYRLTDGDTCFPAHADDACDAVRFIAANVKKYGMDKTHICTLGASAGAHLAMLVGTAGDRFGDSPELENVSFEIRAIVGLSTPLDFTDLSCYTGEDYVTVTALLERFLGGTQTEMPDVYALASPITYVKRGAPPVFLIHGENDTVVPLVQAENYLSAADAAGMDVSLLVAPGANHNLRSPDGDSTAELVGQMVRFLLFKFLLPV